MQISFVFDELKRCVLTRFWLFWSLILLFVVGIICGIVLKLPNSVNIYYIDNCDNYIFIVCSTDNSCIEIFFNGIFNSLFICLLAFLCGSIIYAFPIQLFLIFYKGFILSVTCGIMFTNYGVVGAVLFILTKIIPYILSVFLLIVMSMYSCECGLNNFKSKSMYGLCDFYKRFIFIFICYVIISLLEFILVWLIFRPLSFMV